MAIYAKRIAEAQTGAIDTARLAEAWLALHPASKAVTKDTDPGLAAFLARALKALRDALSSVLRQLWPEGWVLGQQSAAAVLTGDPVDWRGWTPADHAAAREIAGDGLQQLLDSAGIRIQSIAASRVSELADVLQASLDSEVRQIEFYGKPAGVWSMQADLPPRNSASDLAAKLERVLDNPARAQMVAHTEMARAASSATVTAYSAAGVRTRSWLTAEDAKVCVACDADEAAGDVPVGEPFPSGLMMPPGHPWCRCALMPGRTVGVAA